MLFIIILIISGFIFFIALFGDYKTKDLKKDYESWEEIINGK